MYNQLSNTQAEPQVEQSIEPNIEKYRRSSYHLGVAYYIYAQKKKEYNQQQQQQQQHQQQVRMSGFNQMSNHSQNQMLLSTMIQSLGQQVGVGQATAASPPSIFQKADGSNK